jgi:hypothetical protein
LGTFAKISFLADSITIQAEFTAVMEYAGKEYTLEIKNCLQHHDHNVYFFVTGNDFRHGEHYEMKKTEVISGKWVWQANAHGTDDLIKHIGQVIDAHHGLVK